MSEDANGTVKISDDVIAVTAAVAATKVEGVASLVGGITDNITKNLLRMNVTKGVKVSYNDNAALIIDIFVNVFFGYKIAEVAWEIQESVKNEIRTITGEVTKAVNIHVQGVEFAKYDVAVEGEKTDEEK